MGLLRKIESAGNEGTDGQPTQLIPDESHVDNAAIADKYKNLIRQLPARPLTQKLVDIYFRHLNWHYSFLEEVIFREQLEEWNSLPYALFSKPLSLPAETRVFPALLFIVVATAMLVLEDVEDVDEKEFEGLKYAGGMTWEDLAVELCESGKDLLRLFEKRHVAMATVQAEFLMAAFTKYTAKVAESVRRCSVPALRILWLTASDSGIYSRVRSETLRSWACTAIASILGPRIRVLRVYWRISGSYRSGGRCI